MAEETLSFEELLHQYEPMIHSIIHRLGIMDPHQEFYQEGVLALWEACQTYQEEKGKRSTYTYFIIRTRLINLIRKKNRKQEQAAEIMVKSKREATVAPHEFEWDPYLYQAIIQVLSDNQRKWFDGFVLQDLSIKQIAAKEQVTIDAVKNWGRLAKKKLKAEPVVREYVVGQGDRSIVPL